MDGKMEYPFEFSVVMAVYNVEPWLREAVDSLIHQDFGFERIQLIMVDDGSTDSSGAICDEYAGQYPQNVVVIHKENGGVASARNEGLKYATGRFLNFMDSDDKFTTNTMREVYRYFCQWEEDTDVVTIPMQFFDAQRGDHWQNGKFKHGSRVINLHQDYTATLMTMCASFVVNRCKKDICFDARLCVGEDAKVLLKILAEKMKMGVVNKCKYLYRRRSAGEKSLIQTSKSKRGWYFDYLEHLIDWAIDYYREKFGYLPGFLQYQLVCDLQWKFVENREIDKVLSDQEIEEYKEKLFQTMQQFDDKYILEQKMIWEEEKCYILGKKYQTAPTISAGLDDALVHFQNTNVINLSHCYTKIDFIKVAEDCVTIEGYTKFIGISDKTEIFLFVLVNKEVEIPCKTYIRKKIGKYCYGDDIYPGIAFRCSIPLKREINEYSLRFGCYVDGIRIIKSNLRFGVFSPIDKKIGTGYYYKDGWVLAQKGGTIYVTYSGLRERIKRERLFLSELWKKNTLSARKAVLARLAYHVLKILKRKPIWLICDRVNKADDNGEALFLYVQEHHKKEINAYFAISPESTDYERLKKVGKVVPFLGWRYKLLYLLSDRVISSQGEDYIFHPFQRHSELYRDLCQNSKFVFLQHGVTKDDLSDWLNRYKQNMAMFVTTTRPEYDSILNGDYHYSTDVVKLTGFPRYDRLYRQEKRQITIMPTWRAYLVTGMDAQTGRRELKSGFQESLYFAMYDGILNDRRLFDAAERLGYTVAFLNHPNMSSTKEKMTRDERLKVLDEECAYRDIFAESDLLITDYSSVAFDFAYLRKPVLYFQKDVDEFFSGVHTYEKGYFDYETDGFGEIEYSVDALVNRIIEYMETGCRLKEKYRKRIDATFPFSDQNNCQRVYEEILKLDNRE